MPVVDRCVCRGVTFAELKELADRTGADFDEIADQTGCGTGCSMCVPYIRKMLESGETYFELMPKPARKWFFQKK